MVTNIFQGMRRIAHRGASRLAPENTLPALRQAVAHGVRCIECDVMLTGDGVPIVMHDETVDRTTNGQGRVSEMSYGKIATLDAGSWFDDTFKGVSVPTLAEWLRVAVELGCSLNIELKAKKKGAKPLAAAVNEALQQSGYDSASSLLISSSNKECLVAMHQIDNNTPLALVADRWPWRCVPLLNQLHCVSLNINYKCLTPARIKRLHTAGLAVLAYTVNDNHTMETLFRWGVDGIFTDHV
jgi:glycerophosphoryl diester phosphodiesterase